ncbi:HXXEE domain-containing protein [Ligilactobacillus cholophilus]
MSILFNYWILPLIFIFHDLEEIIMVPIWKKKFNIHL